MMDRCKFMPMKTTDNIPQPWIANRILAFFNRVEKPLDLVMGIQDYQTGEEGRAFHLRIARRILQERAMLPLKRFSSVEQIDNVPGVGPERMRDLFFTFGTPASEVFERSLFDDGVLLENWTVLRYEWAAETDEAFREIVEDTGAFRKVVRDLAVRAVMETAGLEEPEALSSTEDLLSAYIDTYTNSTDEASLALSLWFYRFDADNWFSYYQILEQCDAFFTYHNEPFGAIELRLFKGFDNGVFVQLVTAPDLLVTVNYVERVVTLWVVGLAD